MGSYGGFYKGDKKKKKKETLEKQAGQFTRAYVPPKVEIVGKKGKKEY